MATATFHFHGVLERFLAPAERGRVCTCACARAATLKNAIEARGVPHTEIGRILVNGAPVTLSRIVRDGDAIEVFPVEPPMSPGEEAPRFLADAHLGGLARFLRMLGFDTRYDNAILDRDIVEIARREHRIVLTRDRELLKCRDVDCGCYVHTLKAEAQLREVVTRYGLLSCMQPFTLCLHCNLRLHAIDPDAARERVPDGILARYLRFAHCPGCDRIYWEGSHWDRMRNLLSDTLGTTV